MIQVGLRQQVLPTRCCITKGLNCSLCETEYWVLISQICLWQESTQHSPWLQQLRASDEAKLSLACPQFWGQYGVQSQIPAFHWFFHRPRWSLWPKARTCSDLQGCCRSSFSFPRLCWLQHLLCAQFPLWQTYRRYPYRLHPSRDFWCDFASREHLRSRDVGAGGLFVLQSSNLYQMKALDE